MSKKKKQQKKLKKAVKNEIKGQKKSGAVKKEIGWKLTHFLLLGRIIAKFNDIAEKIYDYWW